MTAPEENDLGFDPEDVPSATDGDQATLALLVSRYVKEQTVVDDLTARLREANAALTATRERDLPDALRACHYAPPTKIVISGCDVEFRDEFGGKKVTDPAAHAWLDTNGHGDLLKHVLTVRFGRGDEVVAREVLDTIRSHQAANRLGIDLAKWVEPQTIAAFAREQCASGTNPPLELLGVSRRQAAKVTPKEPR